MRVVRPALCLALAASVVVTGAANAAKPKHTTTKPIPVVPKVCNLIVGDSGDATPQYTPVGPQPTGSDDALDILSADIASDAKSLTVVLRVKNLSASTPTGTTGRQYNFLFTLPGGANPVFLAYQADATGRFADYGDVESVANVPGNYIAKGPATFVADTAKNELRISAPLSGLSSLGSAAPGVKITGLEAQTWASNGEPDAVPNPYLPGPAGALLPLGVLSPADDDSTKKSYIAGTPSCVTPGA